MAKKMVRVQIRMFGEFRTMRECKLDYLPAILSFLRTAVECDRFEYRVIDSNWKVIG